MNTTVVFHNKGTQPADTSDLDCPACGGSGHAGDVTITSEGGMPPFIPTEAQILAATEKAWLWPNTVYAWLPAFHRYHAELFKMQSQAQQTESNLIDLMAKHGICVEFSHDQMVVAAYWCGNPDRVFRQYNKGNLADAIKTCVTTVASTLPPAPEG